MMVDFSKLCSPAKLYFGLVVLSSLFALMNRMPILGIFVNLVMAFIWTFILNYLCSKGFKIVSWFLVLFPFMVIALGFVGFIRLTKSQKDMLLTKEQQKMML
jgi:hypothetical protein